MFFRKNPATSAGFLHICILPKFDNMGRMNRWTQAAIGTALFLIGGAGGYVLPHGSQLRDAQANREGGYEFVNPLLTCDINEDQPNPGFSNLEHNLQSEIAALKKNGDITRMSVYFRDMNYGTWTGVNVDDTFIPASLMKVPLLVAYLRDSQTSPALLTQKYSIPAGADANAEETFKPNNPLAPGEYTVNQLLEAMILGSDNNAVNVLDAHVSTTSINDIYNAIELPPSGENDETMSPKSYMALFRILYNATYLWRGKSQTAFELLSKSEFKDGIVAGTPSRTVAHKFGERSVYIQDATGKLQLSKRELHDCGIVYYPQSPYGLCIMTEGADFTRMSQAIAVVSSVVYQSVEAGILTSH